MLETVSGRRVCLTFDDGPDPGFTLRLLDLLARRRCRATFFVLGEPAARWPDIVRRIVAEGHSLGCHGFRHRRSRRLSETALREDIGLAVDSLSELAGRAPRWYRPPFGNLHAETESVANRLGMEVVLWSRSAIDWGPLGFRTGVARRLSRIAPGDIVLMHDGRRRINRPGATLAALPEILDRLRARDIAPVGLDEAVSSTDGLQINDAPG